MASMLSSPPARNMLRVAIARAIREARPPSIAFAALLPITSRTPLPARRWLAAIDRTKGSTQSVGLGGASGIRPDTIAVRLSHIKIWASPIWICWTKDRTRSRSSSDASLVQRSAGFADPSSTARRCVCPRANARKYRDYSGDHKNRKYAAISRGFVAEQTGFEPKHALYMHRF